MRSPTQFVPALAVAGMAAAALLTAWFSLRPAADTGRPDRPLEVSVVRAPPLDRVPDTRTLGGPPADTSAAAAAQPRPAAAR